MTDTQTAICTRLQPLHPELIKLIDDSHLHAGHSGNNGGGHYRLLVVSDTFNHQPRLVRQRQINQLLDDLFTQKIIHALSIRALTHKEYLSE